ncbi:MAG: MATE family efflux transporter [Myxococcales bacterium]|nr:MATE family efflux transporter [Myxococcales bacterium]
MTTVREAAQPGDDADDGRGRAPKGVHDMTRGSVRGHVVRMTLFVLAGLAIQTLYALVDIYWVGRLGKQAVAAVALSSNLGFAALAVTQMLSVGCVALVSQAAGKKDHAEVQRLFNQAQSLSAFAGAAFLTVGLAVRRTYVERLSPDAHTAELASTFLLTFIPALALQFTMVGLGSTLRGIGDMKPGLVAQIASVLLNMVLAPFLVFGWVSGRPLGVAGASIATLVSTAAAIVGLVVYLARGDTFLRVKVSEWWPDLSVWRRMVGIGLPAGTEFLLMTLIFGVIYVVARPFGAHVQAGFGVGSRLVQAGFMPAVALSFASAAVVGQNYGSREYARVREAAREATKLVVAVMLVFTVACHVAPERLMRLFTDEPGVVAAGVDYLETISYAYVASGIVFTAAGVFQGLGNTWPSLMASGARALAFVGVVLWLSRRTGFAIHTVWVVSVSAGLLQLALQLTLLRRELRLKAPLPSS